MADHGGELPRIARRPTSMRLRAPRAAVKPARFHPEAEVELAAEAACYEELAAGLGER